MSPDIHNHSIDCKKDTHQSGIPDILKADGRLTPEEKKYILEMYECDKESIRNSTNAALKQFILRDYGATNERLLGSKEGIRNIQKQLGAIMGQNIAADGAFWVQTLALVFEFQKQNNIQEDGIVWPETQKLLKERSTNSHQIQRSYPPNKSPASPIKLESIKNHTPGKIEASNSVIQHEVNGDILSLNNLPSGTKITLKTDIEYPQDDYKNIPLQNGGKLTVSFPDGRIFTSDISKPPISFKESISQNTDSLSRWLLSIGAMDKEGRIYRDRRLAWERVQVESSYISGEAVMYYINSGNIHQAEIILTSAVEAAIKNNGKIPRLYYWDGTPEWVAATNGDASTISIALGKYLQATSKSGNTPFRQKAQEANAKIQKWLGSLQTYGDPAFVAMSDDNPLMDGIETRWTTSVSVENNARRIMSLQYTNPTEWKRQLQKLIDASWDPETKQFASGIDTKTMGPTKEYARDAFSLLVLAADKYGMLNFQNKNRFIQAAQTKPAFSLEDGTFWYSQDHHPDQVSAIPEFMYLDVAAMRVLWLDSLAKKHMELADKSNRDLNGGYSTEYQNENPNAINVVMRENVTAWKNYYA